jgi:hypothetical protein
LRRAPRLQSLPRAQSPVRPKQSAAS